MRLVLLLTLLAFAACSPTYYNSIDFENKEVIDFDKLEKDGDAILVFKDKLGGIKLINIENSQNSVYVESGLGYGMGSGLTVVRAKPGRYVFAEGTFDKSIVRICPSSISFGNIGLIVTYVMANNGSWYMSPMIGDNEAILYLDAKPGQVYYIGDFDSRFFGCKIAVEDNFSSVKEDLSYYIPDTANKMKNNFITEEKKPKSCYEVQKEGLPITPISKKQMSTPEYKKCMSDISKLAVSDGSE